MQKTTRYRFAYSGWLAAALIVGIVAGTGFQDSMKLGVVNLDRVITESRLQNEAQVRVQAARADRLAVLDFMNIQKVLTREQCERLRELKLKDDKTAEEDMEILTIQTSVEDAVRDLDRISGLVTLTEDERDTLGDYVARKNTTERLLAEWATEFESEFQNLAADIQREMIEKAQNASQAVAGREGFTLVFSMTAVVYAADDITDMAIEEANK